MDQRAATTTTASGNRPAGCVLSWLDQIYGCAWLKEKRLESSELDDYEAWTSDNVIDDVK